MLEKIAIQGLRSIISQRHYLDKVFGKYGQAS